MSTDRRVALGPVGRLFRRVLAWLWAVSSARKVCRGQGRQNPDQARALLAGPIVVDKRDAGIIAWNGCMHHYGFDTSALPIHERAAIRKAVESAMKAGDSKEMCMTVAAIKLREIVTTVNGIKERA